ncbi:unnamed protein product [Chilo suppressalis]|uniref:MADF domain-containing protein n=1 Tax=Chilo suppressalis TaxID=168631 RepID=A0ABN8AVN1_CHISP|nr:unnamed protein product [Chilo suppressalis]
MAPNTEIFIGTVRKYPELYDNSHCDYKNTAVKNRIWDDIAEMLGECDGDTLKKQWKNLRDAYSKHLRSCNAKPGEETKLIDRYRCWPWASVMSFLRPHLEITETHSNRQRNSEKAGASHSINTSSSIELDTQSQQIEIKFEPQHDIQHMRTQRKRTKQSQSNLDNVLKFRSKKTEKDDDTDLLFKSYAKKLKKMSNRRQATVKFKFAKIMLKAELEEADEMQSNLEAAQYQENDMVMIIQPPASSAGSDTDD